MLRPLLPLPQVAAPSLSTQVVAPLFLTVIKCEPKDVSVGDVCICYVFICLFI